MRCRLCGRHCAEELSSRTWKVCGRLAFCPDCRRTRCRRRAITARVAEPVGRSWKEFDAALDQAIGREDSLLIQDSRHIELGLPENDATIRVLIADHWWTLRLSCSGWSSGRRADYTKILAGETLAMELSIRRKPPSSGLRRERQTVVCRIAAWLLCRRRTKAFSYGTGTLTQQDIVSMELNKLRREIHLNRVSFPAQAPSFPGAPGDGVLQRKLAQLYFVLGWSCPGIAARYRLLPQHVRHILNVWRARAAKAGYIQHIPPAVAIGPSEMLGDPAAADDPHAADDSVPVRDQRLIAALRAGDSAGYEELIERFQNPVFNLAWRLLDDPSGAADVTQTVFVKAFRGLEALSHTCGVRTWLYRIAVNECLYHPPGAPPVALIQPRGSSAVEKALRAVTPALRCALILRERENLSYAEIAEIVQAPVQIVRSRIMLGRESLRRNCAALAGPPDSAATKPATHVLDCDWPNANIAGFVKSAYAE